MKNRIKSYFQRNINYAIKAKQLANDLNIYTEQEYEAMKAFLHRLCEEGFLVREGKRYKHLPKENGKTVKGEFNIMKDGSGFLFKDRVPGGGYYISSRYFNTAFHGDTVEISVAAKELKGRNRVLMTGQVINVLERKWNVISGTLTKEGSFYIVKPDIPEIHRNLYIHDGDLNGAKVGDRVFAGNIQWTNPKINPEAKVIEVVPKGEGIDLDVVTISREFNLPFKFSNGALEEAKEIRIEISPEELAKREDFRDKDVFTIDPADAKDFDDALSLQRLENGNYEIGVHIADVGHYVKPDSKLDKEALERGNSVYLVGAVIPMLPESLSNGICSLVPGEERLTYSAVFEITPRGKVLNYRLVKTVIKSKRRFSYEEAQEVIKTGKGDLAEDLTALNKIAEILRNKRMKAGSIEFGSDEVEFILGEEGEVLGVKRKVQEESNKLIEEFMLLANKTVAEHINKKRREHEIIPFVYRIHDKPDKEKMREFARFVKSLGYTVGFNDSPTPQQLNALMNAVKLKEEEVIVNELAIRSMAKAAYSTENIGHYGLGFKDYTHFTSPIRRYSDLLAHRILAHFTETKGKGLYKEPPLRAWCEHISLTERTAIEAERLSVRMKYIEYLQPLVGQEFDGIISGVTSFGFFVKLADSLAEGLVHVRDIESDYFTYEEKYYLLKGERSGKTYRLGDKVRVKLIRVIPERSNVDFTIA
ncbi:MAG: ribonuclease R [Ignavibacteriales bacterium]|nr:MAG: ribonuclease R [Ignavibacteriaceae bacterium]MBW7872114.1 ribonuclease R [Ignavibacteria bacterium]MCZ2143748.1 ribonuclease R [Ignavibacteriales bacterium]MBV6445991.1 Ribonuclease R [Ignavibacteriaceae bacterium]MBZ0197759.1 ribonuclease R [Ignavibacteriaceae bacterium]